MHLPLGDFNGDGFADIAGFGSGGVWIALNQGDGTFATAELAVNAFGTSAAAGGWSSNDNYPRLLADVTGDGLVDILGIGSDYTYLGETGLVI